MAALTDEEKERVRYHLGYPTVQLVGSVQFGLPRPLQTAFILESSMASLIATAIDRVRRYLQILDDIECKLVDAQCRLAAKQLGEITLRDDEPDKLEHEYWRWASRLADILGVPLYYYSNRFKGQSGVAAGNIPVSNS